MPARLSDDVGSLDDLLHADGAPPATLTIARAIRVLSAGNHHPLLCEMESSSGPAGVWVVKPCIVLSRATDRGAFAILTELAGAAVCGWAGLSVPHYGLARFPTDVQEDAIRVGASAVEPTEGDEIVQVFRANRGRLAFCVRYLDGASDLRPVHLRRKRWRTSSVRDATCLVLVDAVIRHDDRLEENPNAVWYGNRLVPIDHGAAFAGLNKPGVRGHDLAARTQLHAPNFSEHVARSVVRRYASDLDWETAVAQLETVPDHAIAALCESWPSDLDADDQCGQGALRSRLASFLAARRQHVRQVASAVRSVIVGSR